MEIAPPSVMEVLMSRELLAVAEERVLPRSLAEEVSVATGNLMSARLHRWWEMKGNYILDSLAIFD